MNTRIKNRLAWLGGVLSAWFLVWLLLGIRIIPIVRNNPQPFVGGAQLTGPLLQGVISWVLATLVAYLLLGLLLGLLGQVFLAPFDRSEKSTPGFLPGIWVGLAGVFWFHGLLYVQVPSALHSLPLFKAIPIGLVLGMLLGGGVLALWMAIRSAHIPLSWVNLRIPAALLMMGAPLLLPHDAFRKAMPGPSPLDRNTPRLLILGVDALSRDLLETHRPDWAAPQGCSPITAVPATRKAWLSLYGSDPEYSLNAVIMAERSELQQPERLKLLVAAERKGLRTAFVINDSLTPSFGLQPSLFSDVVEPDGGWKYWFTLGYGTCWPAYSWIQNYFSPIETTNAWSDPEVYWRDLGRTLEGHHWVSSHDCELHVPITLKRAELQTLDPWRWLLHPAKAYHPYTTAAEYYQDRSRLTWRADALLHYQIRVRRLIDNLAPHLDAWSRHYPQLSGVFTSDHGEEHIPLVLSGKPVSHLNGLHGYLANAVELRVPLHPFGITRTDLKPDQVWSWFDLRDEILQWIQSGTPLELKGRMEGWVVQFPAFDPRAFLSNPTSNTSSADQDQGIRINELARSTYLLPNGAWYIQDADMAKFKMRKKSTALVTARDIVAFNPMEQGQYSRTVFHGTQLIQDDTVTKDAMEHEIEQFRGARPIPVVLPQ